MGRYSQSGKTGLIKIFSTLISARNVASHNKCVSIPDHFPLLFTDDDLPTKWTLVVDHEKKISFVRLENWAYQNNCVKTEITIMKTAYGGLLYFISCCGQEVSIDNVVKIDTLAQQPIKEQIMTVLKLLKDPLCSKEFLLKKTQLKHWQIVSTAFSILKRRVQGIFLRNKQHMLR